jgi:hypothetical protein
MSVHAQLLELLADGEWHSEADLMPITPYPREWMTELRHDGHEVVEDPAGMQAIRIREGSAGAPWRSEPHRRRSLSGLNEPLSAYR